MTTISTDRRRSRRNILFALLSGGVLVAVGTSVTLASWSDEEWVFAGNGVGGPGVATETFEIQQNVSTPYVGTTSNWVDRESNPGSSLTFGTGALKLSPGTTIYAPVAIRSTAESIAGKLVLTPAVASTGVTTTDDGTLWNAIAVRVSASESSATCNATSFAGAGSVVASGGLSSAAIVAGAALNVSAASGNVWHFCFELTLPTSAVTGDGRALQGKTIAPAWKFSSTSV